MRKGQELSVKNYDKYKRVIRFFAGIFIIAIESVAFMYVWIYCYNEHMEMPYQRMGHYFLAAVYAVIYMCLVRCTVV